MKSALRNMNIWIAIFLIPIFLYGTPSLNSTYAATICSGTDVQAGNTNQYNAGATLCKNGKEIWKCIDGWVWDGFGHVSSCDVGCVDGTLTNPDVQATCSGCYSVSNDKFYKENSTFCVSEGNFGHSIYKCNANQQQAPTSTSCPLQQPGDISTCVESYDTTTNAATALCATPTPKPIDNTQQCLFNGQTLMGNESKCGDSTTVVTCNRSDANCNSDGICLYNCASGASGQMCIQNGTNASCASPTATPTPTSTPMPTATPPPAAGVTCPDGHNAGDIYCGDLNWTSVDVVRCDNSGTTEVLGYCSGIGDCLDVLPPNEPVENICTGLASFSPVDPADTACRIQQSKGQQNPQAGLNCGIPVEEPVLVDGSGTYVYQNVRNHPLHRCCLSDQSNVKNSVACLVDPDLPGLDTLQGWFFDYVWPVAEKLPAVWDNGPNAFNIGRLKLASSEIPACRSDSAPLDLKKPTDPDCYCGLINGVTSTTDALCENSPDSEKGPCLSCVRPSASGGQGGVWTGLGCIVVENQSGFVERILGMGVGIGGAMSLLCLMYGAFMFQTSRGSPETLKKARDLITSCITGMLMIVFAIFILRLVGYTILRIPGFGG